MESQVLLSLLKTRVSQAGVPSTFTSSWLLYMALLQVFHVISGLLHQGTSHQYHDT